jgi:hypothetical protein
MEQKLQERIERIEIKNKPILNPQKAQTQSADTPGTGF